MAEPSAAPWHPSAAYLYLLHLDGPGLAWEYLRRHPDYVRDWWIHRRGGGADPWRWGLRQLEDPAIDARDAQPVWTSDTRDAVQLHPDLCSSPEASRFDLWQLPGHKRLAHDGHRLRLFAQFALCALRLVLSPAIEDGMAIACAVPTDEDRVLRWQAAELILLGLDFSGISVPRAAATRPTPSAITHLRSLQALDGVRAGASLKQVAAAIYGTRETSGRWHAESELRAHVRYLVRRGRNLMHGGYRRLLHPRRSGKGEISSA